MIFILLHRPTAGFTPFASFCQKKFPKLLQAGAASSPQGFLLRGLQIAFAFYIVNLNEFTIQTSLSVARDRAIGVLLGIFMMWLVFERFQPKTAAATMIELFIRNLRLLAQLTVFPGKAEDPQSLPQIRKLRDQIYQNFSTINAQADAVPFETGRCRPGTWLPGEDARWQPALRTFYLMEMPLLQFRLFGLHSDMSDAVRQVEHRFQQSCADILNSMADCLEMQLTEKKCDLPARENLESILTPATVRDKTLSSPSDETMLRLSRNIATLLERLDEDVTSRPLFAAN